MAQCPAASDVAGFNKWLELGRCVRKGEKAIRIRGFANRELTAVDSATGEQSTVKVPAFPIVSVFDVSQTEPITEVSEWMRRKNPAARTWVDAGAVVSKLTGEDPERIYERAHAFITGEGWTVRREAIAGPVNGYTTTGDGLRSIVVDESLSPAMAAKTLIHETAHALMHANLNAAGYAEHRGRCEVEAESVAYVVAGLLGLDTSDYSVGGGCARDSTPNRRRTRAAVAQTARSRGSARRGTARVEKFGRFQLGYLKEHPVQIRREPAGGDYLRQCETLSQRLTAQCRLARMDLPPPMLLTDVVEKPEQLDRRRKPFPTVWAFLLIAWDFQFDHLLPLHWSIYAASCQVRCDSQAVSCELCVMNLQAHSHGVSRSIP